uniref:Uncharacterized protein n=1 Tax=Zooxanthella nutricula TaxID=1333877 RepID=A0A7S2QB07_9DINO
MPHYDPLRHTTNDVVRAAIVPASRGRSGGVAYTALLEAPCEETRPSCLVTHDWRNLFVHLVAAVVADALGMQEYNDVASMLIRGRADALARRLKENAKMDMRYWICAFCVNQHSSICGGFGGPPGEEGSAEYERWDANRRDSVTGDLHRCCPCAEPKLLNDSPEHTELNKFDDVMALLFVEVPDFRQLVAVDREFNLFTRLWCVAELVQAYFSGIPQNVCLHVSSALDVDAGDTLLYNKLADLTVTNCRATRPEDKEAILAKIPDTAEFDAQLQNMIFCERGLFGKKLVGFDIPRTAALIARRVKALPVEKEASGATPTGRRAPWRTAWQHMTSRLSMESAGEP